MLGKVPHVSGENHLALSIQRLRDLHPARDDGLSCLGKFGACRLAKAAVFASSVAIFVTVARMAVELPRR